MIDNTINRQAAGVRSGKVGWIILLVLSALLLLSGLYFFLELPNMALANIAKPAGLAEGVLQVGTPSSFDVITLITRNYAIGFGALGLLSFLVALEGYRHGTRWAWLSTWAMVAAIAAMGINFLMAGGVYGASIGYLGLAAVALAGQLLAYRGLASEPA